VLPLLSSQALRAFNIKTVCINPGYVATPMCEDHKGVDHSLMIKPEDVAEAAMLALTTSATCCPSEITVRPVKPVYMS
jgi:short-subunit dehydrogenase